MTWLRSALFNVFFFVSTFMLTVPASIIGMFSPDSVMAWARAWAKLQIWGARVICGIKLNVTGWENMPSPPVVIASRHESTFDILVWIALLPAACFVVKRELGQIPLFGTCIRATKMILVDREAGASAIRALLRGGDTALRDGRHIIIFPEGTRTEPGQHPPLQPGVAALAARTHLPVVPVMTNSGSFWGRRAFRKQPGTIQIRIQPALTAAQGRDTLLNALSAAFDPNLLAGAPSGEENGFRSTRVVPL